PQDWSSDGQYVLAVDREPSGSRLMQLVAMRLDGSHKLVTLTPRMPNDFGGVRFSPDGRWVAYDLDESGRREIYVVSFPDGQNKIQISSGGGVSPKWSRGGREIVYSSFDNKVMSVEIDTAHGLLPGSPKELFSLPEGTGFGWDVSRDGEKFLFNVPVIKSS